jgi:AcrR family transcriptional regulator
MPPRPYTLGSRRDATEATRERILEAARALIGGKGDLDDFSMDGVAEKAGVSRMTVYNQFESRTGLLDALADHLATRGGMQRMREVFGQPDLEAGIRRFVQVFVHFWASDRTTLRRMRAIGVLFPSLHKGLPARDAWRLEAATNLLARFGDARREALPPNSAELLSALTSFETFDELCTETRTPEEVAEMLAEVALTLLRDSPARKRRGKSPR